MKFKSYKFESLRLEEEDKLKHMKPKHVVNVLKPKDQQVGVLRTNDIYQLVGKKNTILTDKQSLDKYNLLESN